jgi:cold shock CspA family protein
VIELFIVIHLLNILRNKTTSFIATGIISDRCRFFIHFIYFLAAVCVPPSKEINIKYFGTVESFDSAAGNGQIKPETGGNAIRFETTAIMWDKNTDPVKGQRLSYDLGSDRGQPRALNLQII